MSTMSQAPRRKSWMSVCRHQRLNHNPGSLAQALKVFKKDLAAPKQWSLIEEIVDTRTVELLRAYPDLVDVAAGYKRIRTKGVGRQRILKQPCIVFTVRRKRPSQTSSDQNRQLPTALFAYCTVSGERRLCAVPTDVDDARDFGRFYPQGQPRPIEVHAAGNAAGGVVTCAIERSAHGDKVFAISCRHVFAQSKMRQPDVTSDASLRFRQGQAVEPFGKTTKVRGPLRNGPGLSLDSQLARIDDLDLLRAVLGDLIITDFVRNPDDWPDNYWLVTPHRAIRAKFSKTTHQPLDYGRSEISSVIHRKTVISQLTSETLEGDSGAPLVTGKFGGVLLGMHIAGDSANKLSLAIPAWQFMFPDFYHGAPNSEVWTPIDA